MRERLATVAGPRPRPIVIVAGRVLAHRRGRPAARLATTRPISRVKLRGRGQSRRTVEWSCV